MISAGAVPRWRGSRVATQIVTLTGRSLRALASDPRAAVLGAIGPMLMLLILSQVFGSIANQSVLPSGVQYLDYLVPAIWVTTAVSAGQVAGQALVQDMHNGVFARLRSLPIRPFSLLVARSVAELARYAAQLVLLLAFAIIALGFAPGGALRGLLASLILTLPLAWALIWTFIALAAWLRSAEVLQSIGVLMFPVMFASSAFAPTAQLPGWLRAIATVNPLTYGIDALRGLALGLPGGSPLAAVGAATLLGCSSALVAARMCRKPQI